MEKRIVIFGATGGTGIELVKHALEKGYIVTAFVRNPEKINISNQNLTIYKGNVLDAVEVTNAINGVNAVFCCLGMPSSDKSTLRADGTANIIKAMETQNVRRFICQTSLGFGDSIEVLPWHMKYIIVPFILKNAFYDHELQEKIIEKSSLNWTIVRPGNMTNGKRTETYKHGFAPKEKIKLKISRADVAHFMLNQFDCQKSIGEKIGISY